MESSIADNGPSDNFEPRESIPVQIENAAFPEAVAEKESQLEVALFSEQFLIPNRGEMKEHTISITQNYLMVDGQAATNVLLGSIIGASVAKVNQKEIAKQRMSHNKSDLFSLTIHLYAKITSKSLFGSTKVTRKAYDLTYYTPDESIANKWRNLIIQAANNPSFIRHARNYSSVDQVPPFKRLLLVFVNPHSGKKEGPVRWEKAKRFLQKAGCEFVEVLTKYSGHARDYLVEHDLQGLLNFDGIVTVSGDGLPHEVINGLYKRPDWEQVKHIPIGPLPGGSGNAIVKNLLVRAEEESNLNNACYLIAKGKTVHADLTAVEVPGKPVIYSFLSIVWAAIAHIDIESEVVRWMGGFRFDLFGAFSIVTMKKYRARVTYSHEDKPLPPLNEEIKGDDWVRFDDRFTYFCLHKMPYISEADWGAPIKDFQDGYNHLIALKGQDNTRAKMTKVLLGLGNGLLGDEEKIKKAGVFHDKVKAFRIEAVDVANNFFSIDGEKYDTDKIQGYIREKAFMLFCTK